jgi:hypothetical protein
MRNPGGGLRLQAPPAAPPPPARKPHSPIAAPRRLSKPEPLVPPHLGGERAPSYFLVSGLVFVALSEPYLEAEYGSDYVSDAPVKLLDRWGLPGGRQGGGEGLKARLRSAPPRRRAGGSDTK